MITLESRFVSRWRSKSFSYLVNCLQLLLKWRHIRWIYNLACSVRRGFYSSGEKWMTSAHSERALSQWGQTPLSWYEYPNFPLPCISHSGKMKHLFLFCILTRFASDARDASEANDASNYINTSKVIIVLDVMHASYARKIKYIFQSSYLYNHFFPFGKCDIQNSKFNFENISSACICEKEC